MSSSDQVPGWDVISTLVPGYKDSSAHHRCDAGDRPVSAAAQEIMETYPEKLGLSVWAALRPEGFLRFFNYITHVMNPDDGTLPYTERLLIAAVVSSQNRCTGCTLLYGRALSEAINDFDRGLRIVVNYRAVELSPRERALCDLAYKITTASHEVDSEDLDRLRGLGLTEEQVFDAIEVAALYNMANRISSSFGIRPDPEFFAWT